MNVADTLERARFDTRGLPEGFDPHELYEYRIQTLSKEATGIESFLYKYIPHSLIRSFAFAIDPFAKFKVAPYSITKANRTKYRQTASVLQQRFYRRTRDADSHAQQPNWGGVSNCWSPQQFYSNVDLTPLNSQLTSQPALVDVLKDTTSRTRLWGSEQGELELFKGFIHSPPRYARYGSTVQTIYPVVGSGVDDICKAHGGTTNNISGGRDIYTHSVHPSGGLLSSTTCNALRASEIAFNKALAQKNAISMLKGWSPFNRDYSLFRNLAELRDLPSSVLSLKETLGNLRKLYASLSTSPSLRKIVFDLKRTSADIPNEYLSYHFGWKQTYKDLMDLLVAPGKISKRYNFLIKRNGKPTTFRTSRVIETAEKDVPGFDYELFSGEYGGYPYTKSRIERVSELRLVINATFDFPPINNPYFRLNDYLDRIGVVPRVTDVYNLVPWTWLVDWFTGLGNYVECIDNINHDPSLINWGFITCSTKGRLITDFFTKTDIVDSFYVFGQTAPPPLIRTTANLHQSVYNYECQTRNDCATILDVKTTSVPSSLTAYQKSIIGALLAQRAEFSRAGSFRVRS